MEAGEGREQDAASFAATESRSDSLRCDAKPNTVASKHAPTH
jgi:hypothetical protein